MIPLGLEWGCQTDLSLARHADILNLAIESGMHSISLGLESIVDANRRAVHKNFFSMAEVENMLKMLYEHGIEVQVNIIFGFDYDTPDIFDETVDFLVRNQVSTCLFSILVPIPGTPLYNQLLNENRLMDVRPPGNDNPLYVGFKPKQMTIEQLVAGYSRAKERFRRERRNPIYWLGSGNHTWTEA
jgi:radical SAM superfamily enzyme YgiQ (UPF0313 family)